MTACTAVGIITTSPKRGKEINPAVKQKGPGNAVTQTSTLHLVCAVALHYDAAAVTLLGRIRVLALVNLRPISYSTWTFAYMM